MWAYVRQGSLEEQNIQNEYVWNLLERLTGSGPDNTAMTAYDWKV